MSRQPMSTPSVGAARPRESGGALRALLLVGAHERSARVRAREALAREVLPVTPVPVHREARLDLHGLGRDLLRGVLASELEAALLLARLAHVLLLLALVLGVVARLLPVVDETLGRLALLHGSTPPVVRHGVSPVAALHAALLLAEASAVAALDAARDR